MDPGGGSEGGSPGCDLDNGAAPDIKSISPYHNIHTEGPMREGGVLQWLAIALKELDNSWPVLIAG